MSEVERVRGKARALLGRAAASIYQEHCVGPRVATGAMAQAVGVAFRAGVICDRDGCSAPATSFRTVHGRAMARCGRHPGPASYRRKDLERVVTGWRGRGGETRDRSVAACQRRLDAAMGRQ